jgi:hypothetical protein
VSQRAEQRACGSRRARIFCEALGGLLMLAFGLGSTEARAQDYQGARLFSLAGGHRAILTGADALYTNPAGIAFTSGYRLESAYVDDFQGFARQINSSIVDGQAGPLAGGAAYTYTNSRPTSPGAPNEKNEGHRFDVAMASLVGKSVGVGVSGRYLTFDRKADGTTVDGFSAINVDVGVQVRLAEGIAIGAAGHNLTNSDRPELPIGWSAGFGILRKQFSLAADIVYNAQVGAPRFSGGGQFFIEETFVLRGGFGWDRKRDGFFVSGGAGLVIDRVNLDVGYIQQVSGDKFYPETERRFGVALSVGVF